MGGGRGEVTCQECWRSGDSLLNRLTSPVSLIQQAAILIDRLCPDTEDPEACVDRVGEGWPVVGKAAYPHMLHPKEICQEMGVCPGLRMTCPDCHYGLGRIAEIMTLPSTVEDVVTYLQGEGLCEIIDVLDCAAYMAYVMPRALPILAQGLIENR